ncbi:hypothetical protein [Halorubrum sp. CSM-61]|uniref:DUF7344 domain-containing protein n=1 Tax=Halorubrum sp. CSM-61 TaxID=2485838 RepID=UPI000F4C8FE0|nr:hypothetical protein [Halorubrum sp. CSM-61]
MSDTTGEAQIRIGGSGDRSLVVEAEMASDEVLSAMADERRRQVLAVISGESAPIDLSTLAERVADRLGSRGSKTESDQGIDRLSVALHHRHLPKMASAGLIDYDAESQTIQANKAVLA